ncbi:MAG: hypothetical protein N3D16_04150 [Anaerolineales bacterium]|nr:hypothetical protein [Anaerolineales bacterium]
MIVFTNITSHWVNLQGACFLSTMLIFVTGVLLFFSHKPTESLINDWWKAFPPFFLLLLLFLLFLRINQGLAIFDENYNLPIVSRIAAGDVPPHFPFDSTQPLAYHYGLHLLAGAAVSLGGVSPWLAFDAIRAFTHAILLVLASFWFYRQTQHLWASILAAGLVYLAGSTQWLLLLIPLPWLEQINQAITLTNTAVESGSTLAEVLLSQWKIDGLGPISYPFAFVNALFKPQTLALTSSGASVGMTLCLLLLLDQPEKKALQNILISLVLASIALTAEYLFGILALGSLVVLILETLNKKTFHLIPKAAQIWLPALLLAFTGGGVLTGFIQHQLSGLVKGTTGALSNGLQFTLLWPPVLSTLYFGRLSLFEWKTFLLSFILIGPLIVLFPLSYLQIKNPNKPANFLEQSIFYGATISFAIGLVVGIQDSEGGITRLLDSALLGVLILSVPTLFRFWIKGKRSLQSLIAIWAVLVCMSGMLTFGINLIAIARPQTTYYLRGLDLIFYQRYWNRLEPNAQVFDPDPARAIVVFGRSSGITASDYGKWLPKWKQMVASPDPYRLAFIGYTHAYVENKYWNQLDNNLKTLWQEPCVKLLDEQRLNVEYRRFYDITRCH